MHMASQFPKRSILYERDTTSGKWRGINYAELQKTAEQLACSLIQSRLSPGSTVMIAGATDKRMILCMLGAMLTAHPILVLDSISE